MKRQNVLSILFAVFLTGAVSQAQTPTPDSPEQEKLMKAQQALLTARLAEMSQQVRSRIAGSQDQQSKQATETLQMQRRGGGGRGGAPDATNWLVPDKVLTISRGAWWTNTAVVERLGLTDDQKSKIERAFENHRQDLTQKTTSLQKEEAQLAGFLGAEAIDRNAVLTQIDRVVQARGELERANSAMTLEMREYLTRAQWMQLPQPATVRNINVLPVPADGARGAATGGGGGRGGARGRPR